ncbi:MAG: helicase-related protein, partial [Hyphomicrobium sp.]
TRELAAQCAQSFEKYGVNHKLDVALLIGGVSMDDQVKKLDRGVDVLIATPGRLLDHFGRGRIMLMGVEILVIDEADRMLDMGFIPDIEKICSLLPPRRQTLFFSATMPPEITRLVNQFLRDPERIEVAKPATTAKTITQSFRYCPDGEDWVKREVLRDMIRGADVRNGIIFCNRKRDVAILLKSLLKHGFNAGALHGDMDQKSRTETLDKFRSGEIMFLAASDVAARGLDIPDVSHVFNFDLPWQSDDYVHRIGRTGRAGREGTAQSIVTPEELKSLKDIEKMLGEPVVWIGEAPTEQDFADSGKRRRGRGRGARPGAQRESGRGERGHSERGHGDRVRGERRPGDRAPASEARAEAPRGEARRSSGGNRDERRPSRNTEAREGERGERQARDASRGQRRPEGRREGTPPQAQPHANGTHAEAPPRPESRNERPQADRPPADRPQADRPQAQAQPQAARSRPPRSAEAESPKGGAVGAFAGNVPAFLRRPARPVKAANE